MKKKIIISIIFALLLLSLCGCGQNAQITEEELNAPYYTSLQKVYMEASTDWGPEQIAAAAKENDLFTLNINGTVFVAVQNISASPVGTNLSYLEFTMNDDETSWTKLIYHSDFERAEAITYIEGEWLGLNEEGGNDYCGCYVIAQPDTLFDNDNIVQIPADSSGSSMIEYIHFETAEEAIERLQNVHILLA